MAKKVSTCRWCDKTIYYDRETRLYYAEVVNVEGSAIVRVNYYCPKDTDQES